VNAVEASGILLVPLRDRERGNGEVAEIAQTSVVRRGSPKDAARARAPAAKPARALTPLADISAAQWRALSERAAEPNAYYLPEWELAVHASARGRVGASALSQRPVEILLPGKLHRRLRMAQSSEKRHADTSRILGEFYTSTIALRWRRTNDFVMYGARLTFETTELGNLCFCEDFMEAITSVKDIQ